MGKLIVILIVTFTLHLSATIINVPADQPTIQNGINVSVNGDTVLVNPGTYIENINFNGKLITVASLFLTTEDTTYISNTIIDGNQNGSVVTFNNEEDSTAKLQGFKVRNGSGTIENWGDDWNPYYVELGGGLFINNASPQIKNLVVENNSAHDYGGGMYINGSTSLTLLDLQILDNISQSKGGGLFCENSDLTLMLADAYFLLDKKIGKRNKLRNKVFNNYIKNHSNRKNLSISFPLKGMWRVSTGYFQTYVDTHNGYHGYCLDFVKTNDLGEKLKGGNG